MNETDVVVVDSGLLPCWPQLQAANLVYTETMVRLANSLSLTEYASLPDLTYRMRFYNPVTGESSALIQKGAENQLEPTNLPWPVAVSILTIIRLKDYAATYTARSISLFFSGMGSDGSPSDIDRLLVLLETRPEFEMLALGQGEAVNDAIQEKESKKEEKV